MRYRNLRVPAALVLTVVPFIVVSTAWWPIRGADDTSGTVELPSATEVTIEPSDDPARIMGHKACVKCHESQVRALMHSKHFRTDETLMTQAAQDYADKLGIEEERLLKDSMCVDCHATVQADASGELHAISGVSCERCHGASGGTGEEQGWLKPHAIFGPDGTEAEDETPEHREQRITFCEQQGLVRPARLYTLAKQCFQCHIVDNEKLVNAGHKAGSTGFELSSWSDGEVRHNFHENQQVNATAPSLWMKRQSATAKQRERLMYAVGLLTDLEVSLRNRAGAETAAYASQMGARVGALQGKLARINAVEPNPRTQTAQQVLAQVLPKIFSPPGGNRKLFNNAADRIAKAAQQFLESHDGSELAGLDGLMAGNEPVGEPYQPAE